MISEKDLQSIDARCPSKKVCRLLVEYRDLAARYVTLRKIKANLVKAFEEEVVRLRSTMKEAGVSPDVILPSREKKDEG